jgi:DNA primase
MGEVIDPGFAMSAEERSRIHAATEQASLFFRRELLRATDGWPSQFLKDRGLEAILNPGATWKIGYAPDGWSQLTDHLQKKGFGYTTQIRAGLMSWTDDGSPVDTHRDQLMLVSRDQRMNAVGFVGISRDGHARAVTPVSRVHLPSMSLVGVQEQIDLLGNGATAVIVDHPADAIALEQLSRATTKAYVGIPLCGALISPAQAQMLARYSEVDRVVVVVPRELAERERMIDTSLGLAPYFDRIRVVAPPPGRSVAALAQSPSGREQLLINLSMARPLVGHHDGLNDNGTQHTSLNIDEPGPDL